MGRAEDQIQGAPGAVPAQRIEESSAPEYRSYTRHLGSLAAAAGRSEAGAVAAVLSDADRVMAESAVVTHLDRRAAHLLDAEGFPAWARAMEDVLSGRDFPARRLREWNLLRSITVDTPWSSQELTGASDWCQRTAVALLTSRAALGLLASAARTRRVRNAAAQRLRKLPES
ncbi:hypothetical protein OG906_30435 [Streptomyces sp. NBC_01426]|uniref:hypothetical protein n=1 Tax=unclassified Streptomyces TaxID=2593676 RepID=UPI002E35C40F|nr:hypothetical protein [Streptomyces sp. NBC_01426]